MLNKSSRVGAPWFREQESRYSRRVEMAEIAKNDFNLNISRYIGTAVGKAEIDLKATHGELVEIEKSQCGGKAEAQWIFAGVGLASIAIRQSGYLPARKLDLYVGQGLARGPEDTVVYVQVGRAWR